VFQRQSELCSGKVKVTLGEACEWIPTRKVSKKGLMVQDAED
jgi:hypothetical protein